MFITSLTPEKATFNTGMTLTKEELTKFLVDNEYVENAESVPDLWNQSDLLIIGRVYAEKLESC